MKHSSRKKLPQAPSPPPQPLATRLGIKKKKIFIHGRLDPETESCLSAASLRPPFWVLPLTCHFCRDAISHFVGSNTETGPASIAIIKTRSGGEKSLRRQPCPGAIVPNLGAAGPQVSRQPLTANGDHCQVSGKSTGPLSAQAAEPVFYVSGGQVGPGQTAGEATEAETWAPWFSLTNKAACWGDVLGSASCRHSWWRLTLIFNPVSSTSPSICNNCPREVSLQIEGPPIPRMREYPKNPPRLDADDIKLF